MIAAEFIARSRYWLVKEYPIKLGHCIYALPDAVIWSRANPGSNSIGNLIIHLAGNVTEWIIGGVGGRTFERDRGKEFSQQTGGKGADLLANLEAVLRDADAVLAGVTEADLEKPIVIQGRETTVLSAIYHVVEHFAMHTGQILLLTKIHNPGAIRFYDDSSGLARPLWHQGAGLNEAAN
ncbi:MAG: DUF1572 domain-containing protein [Gemmatimonadota bacterium]|nr:DUF1572 domain-containing protein [Gemmatimonadota bacterium]